MRSINIYYNYNKEVRLFGPVANEDAYHDYRLSINIFILQTYIWQTYYQ